MLWASACLVLSPIAAATASDCGVRQFEIAQNRNHRLRPIMQRQFYFFFSLSSTSLEANLQAPAGTTAPAINRGITNGRNFERVIELIDTYCFNLVRVRGSVDAYVGSPRPSDELIRTNTQIAVQRGDAIATLLLENRKIRDNPGLHGKIRLHRDAPFVGSAGPLVQQAPDRHVVVVLCYENLPPDIVARDIECSLPRGARSSTTAPIR